MSSHISDLVGKSCNALIGEPWDFCSEVGRGELKGTIVSIPDNRYIVLKVSPFKNENVSIDKVLGVNRYVSSQDIFAELLKGNKATLNFVFALDGSDIENDLSFLENPIDESKHSFLVGSLKVC